MELCDDASGGGGDDAVEVSDVTSDMGSFGISSATVSSISSFQLAARSKKRFLEAEK